ncbi:metal ABC transporter substrate-binding protein [Natronorubrum aibiense]|uniref:Zinc ABC transporter substrate-binding protein n=1 Tax=Natronorubrum aibiense TaxID=348826 RepID=A0A5P9P0K8_9EURY|nr:metal ABC transporter substrate-binding protein [Natronorubrum aibiense]QFU81566.1 zinc ABC transporter substrate-binding protein [Natronorubrum aibiense]
MSDTRFRNGRWSRRHVVSAVGGSAVAGLAGCLGSSNEDGGGPVAVASFFTFYDFARRIAAETPVSVENLVPTGMHGHGWEPDPSIQRDITDADAFIHVGPDFQPWADRAIDTVQTETQETSLINVREGVNLVDLADTLTDEEAVGDAKDPHFWLDPELAMTSVDNIADGLTEIAPDHEDTFAQHAADLNSELEAIDEEWRTIFDAADRDVLFLAAHNAFEYVARRYDVTIEPLVVNLAANDDVRPADMQRAQETIADNGIRHIGAAVFEPIRPARQLLEQTDVEAYYPVTPYAGTAESWHERGWGYFDIARNVNMPTFRLLADVTSPEEVSFADYGRNFEP